MATLQQNMPIQLSMLSFFVVTGDVPSKYVGPAVAKLAEWSIPKESMAIVSVFRLTMVQRNRDFEIGDWRWNVMYLIRNDSSTLK
jgi:hypothetical protein